MKKQSPENFLLIYAVGILICLNGVAQEAIADELPSALSILLAERDEAISSEVDVLKGKYIEGLEKYRKQWAESNQLDDSLAALELRDSLEKNGNLDVQPEKASLLRRELKQVVETWLATTQGYVDQANRKLEKKLKALRVSAIKKGDLDLVKAIDLELGSLSSPAPAGPGKTPGTSILKEGSEWIGDRPGIKFTVSERDGDSFKATFEVSESVVREISGTVVGNKISWLAKDVKSIKGTRGGDNDGTIEGNQIRLVWKLDDGEIGGTFVLQKAKPAK